MTNHNQYISNLVVTILSNLGCSYACISPGARNAPIISALDSNKKITTYSILDERSCGFFGLGIAKKTQTPVILNCTSGSAIANFFPAIIEARMSQIPIIVITADRPKNLINCGANQTIFQNNFYGEYALKTINIDCTNNNESLILKDVNIVYNACLGIEKNKTLLEKGPVHINIHIEEPLLLNNTSTHIDTKIKIPSINKKNNLHSEFKKSFEKPLIICGQTNLNNDKKSILKLSHQIKAPILSDISSNIDFNDNSILYYGHYIDKIKPDIIFRFGKKPLSKKLNNLLDDFKNVSYLITDRCIFNDDIKHSISIQDLLKKLPDKGNEEWLKLFKDWDQKIEQKISHSMNTEKIDEYNFAFNFIDYIPKHSNIFIGNSLMIRAFDSYSKKNTKDILFFSNRGASGIDGNIATAIGIASTSSKNNYLILGDQSFMHDIGSLQILVENNIKLSIFIINNGGGAIFNHLPLSNKMNKHTFNHFISRNHNQNFEAISRSYNIDYNLITKIDQLSTISIDKPAIHEILVNREDSLEFINRFTTALNK